MKYVIYSEPSEMIVEYTEEHGVHSMNEAIKKFIKDWDEEITDICTVSDDEPDWLEIGQRIEGLKEDLKDYAGMNNTASKLTALLDTMLDVMDNAE